MGTLFVVPTPIGNLEDITLRALRVLREVPLIAAEDTRVTGRLLAHYDIKTPQISYHEHNKITRLDDLLAALAGGDVALVSDAGTPGLSDPGFELIQAVLEHGHRVEALPGASALLPALTASGLPLEQFAFIGFLPRKPNARRAALEALERLPLTLAFYEAPHRLVEALESMAEVFGPGRPAVIAREISKLYEEFWRGDVAGALAHFQAVQPRGEFVILIGGYIEAPQAAWDEAAVRTALAERLADGERLSSAAREVARLAGWERRAVYDLGQSMA